MLSKNNKSTLPIKAFFFISSLGLLFFSCKPTYESFRSSYEAEAASVKDTTPDYSILFYWAAHPDRQDPSDSVPKPYRNKERSLPADVFFLHPTTLTDRNLAGKVWNASLNDAGLNLKTDFTSILYQASVFNGSCRVFAPRYRQAHIHSFSPSDTPSAKKAFDLAYSDIRSAFLYYIQFENQGRPIIIASHSQGTLHARRLMKEFFDGTPLQKQLVCAYLLGLDLPADEFRFLLPCNTASSTGCLVGWRTFRTGYVPDYIKREKRNMIVVNPLSWTTDTIRQPRRKNQAAVLFRFNQPYPRTNGAQIGSHVLWIEKPRFPLSFLDKRKNYHPGDINLFYLNIRNNVQQRVDHFLQKKD